MHIRIKFRSFSCWKLFCLSCLSSRQRIEYSKPVFLVDVQILKVKIFEPSSVEHLSNLSYLDVSDIYISGKSLEWSPNLCSRGMSAQYKFICGSPLLKQLSKIIFDCSSLYLYVYNYILTSSEFIVYIKIRTCCCMPSFVMKYVSHLKCTVNL